MVYEGICFWFFSLYTILKYENLSKNIYYIHYNKDALT